MEIESISYRELHDVEESEEKIVKGDDISLISDIEVELDVVVGKRKLTVSELYALKKGGVMQLDADVEDPVEIVLNSSVVARGRLVVVGDNYGIEITETVRDGDE